MYSYLFGFIWQCGGASVYKLPQEGCAKAIVFWAEAAKVEVSVDDYVLLKGVKARIVVKDVSVVQPFHQYVPTHLKFMRYAYLIITR